MLKLLAALCIVQVVFGACSVKKYKYKYENGSSEDDKVCSKGCAQDYEAEGEDLKCIKCANVKEAGSTSKEIICNYDALGCMWKAGKCLPGSCPSIAADQKKILEDCSNNKGPFEGNSNSKERCNEDYGDKQSTRDKENGKALCKAMGCFYNQKAGRCSIMSVWALIVIIIVVVVVVVVIIVVIIIIVLKMGSKPKTVEPAPAAAPASKAAPQATPTGAADAPAGPPPEAGPYVVIKLGKQELKTKKNESQVWGQDIIFTGLGAEDDDVVFELHDNSDALLGSTDVRIPDYVNAKKRATVNLKNGEESIGVLDVDIEIQVQEEPEVKITGVFFVDKFAKPI